MRLTLAVLLTATTGVVVAVTHPSGKQLKRPAVLVPSAVEQLRADLPRASRGQIRRPLPVNAAHLASQGASRSRSASRGARPAGNGRLNWDALAACESSGNWHDNTGNGYYGGVQFDLQTWRSVGGHGLPSNASKAEQIARATVLYRQRGRAPWPVCGWRL